MAEPVYNATKSPVERAVSDPEANKVLLQAFTEFMKLESGADLAAEEMLLDYNRSRMEAATEAADNMVELVVRLSEESGRNKRSMLDAVVALRNAYMEQSTRLATAANAVGWTSLQKFQRAQAASDSKYATWQALADVAGAFDADLTLSRESASLPATLERMLEMAIGAPQGSLDLRQITDVTQWMKDNGVPEQIQGAVAPHIKRGREIKSQYGQAKLEIDNQQGLLNEAERALRNVSDTDPVSTRNVYEKYLEPHLDKMKENVDTLVAQANGFEGMGDLVQNLNKATAELASVTRRRERADYAWGIYTGQGKRRDDARARIIGSENFRQWAALNGYENLGQVEKNPDGSIKNYLPAVEDGRAIALYRYQQKNPGKYGRGFAPGGGRFTRRLVRVTVEPTEDVLANFRMADGSFAIHPETGAYMTPAEVKKYMEQISYAVRGEDGSGYIVTGSEAWKIGADGKPVSVSIDDVPAMPSAALLGPDGKPATPEQIMQFVENPDSIDLTADPDQRAPLDAIRYEKVPPEEPFTVEGELMATHATESNKKGNVISVVTAGGQVVKIPPEEGKTIRVDILAGGRSTDKTERMAARRGPGIKRGFERLGAGGPGTLLSQSSNAAIYDMRGDKEPPPPRSRAADRVKPPEEPAEQPETPETPETPEAAAEQPEALVDLEGVPEAGEPTGERGGGFKGGAKTQGTLEEGVTGPPGGRGAIEEAIGAAPSRAAGEAGVEEIARDMAGTTAGLTAAQSLAEARKAGLTFGESGPPKTIEEKRRAVRTEPLMGRVGTTVGEAEGEKMLAAARKEGGELKDPEDRMRNEATRRLVSQGGSFEEHLREVRAEAAEGGVGQPTESARDRMLRKIREERLAAEQPAAGQER